ncbi:MAG: S46 family peptidase, partial [Planctomycetia bacterium]
MRAGAWTGAVVAIAVASACVAARADEGMWLFSRPPLERIERDHAQALGGARLTPEWLLHLQQSSVRFNSGGSGSFVSADGLVLTNHHVGADSLQKLGDETHNYYRDGFAATSREEELRCPDLELNVLMSIEDVTSRVAAAVSPGMKAEDVFAARRKVMAEIEQESVASTGLRSDVVTLYRGGRYHLYRAKKYTDVRLVFAPEHQIAFFGGDADNFEFPRYNLDACFFRAYEDGQPARVPHHLAWSTKSVRAGDLVFVSGHPGHTDRASTVRELEAKRDRQVPFSLAVLNRLEVLYGAYAAEGPEARRQVMGDLFGVQNGRKNREGVLAGLLDPALMARKRAEESRLRDLVAKAADRHSGPSPFESIEEAEATIGRVALRHNLLEGAVGFNSQYFTNARTILRAAAESARPTGERLREYRDSNRGSLEQQLFSPEPLYDPLASATLADSLTFLATALGPDDPTVARVLAGKPPRERA